MSQDRLVQLEELLTQKKEDLMAVLEILRVSGRNQGYAGGKLAYEFCKHFGYFIARCVVCEMYQPYGNFSIIKDGRRPRTPTRLCCISCRKLQGANAPSRIPKNYVVRVREIEERFAARTPREACGFFFRKHRELKPGLLSHAQNFTTTSKLDFNGRLFYAEHDFTITEIPRPKDKHATHSNSDTARA